MMINDTSPFVGAAKHGVVSTFAAMFLGMIIDVYEPYTMYLVFGVFVVAYWVQFFRLQGQKEIMQMKMKEVLEIASPNEDAQKAVDEFGQDYLVSGGLVELVCHHTVLTRASLYNTGWLPGDIEVDLKQSKFDFSGLLSKIGKLDPVELPNGSKYSLIKTPFITEESYHLKLELEETDFQKIENAKTFFKNNTKELRNFGSIDLRENKIPSSLCLHYIVRLRGGDVLIMKRAKGMAYHSNKWSVTGEEQLCAKDFEFEKPIENLFKRALAEELLKLGGVSDLDDEIMRSVSYMRVFSVGIEWPLYNPALFGFFQLKENAEELKEKLLARNHGLIPYGSSDNEGKFYILDPQGREDLLYGRKAEVRSFWHDHMSVVDDSGLHPTSRYRLLRMSWLLNEITKKLP